MFSAALRLPASYSWSDRKEKVDKVIDELGLLKVAKSRVCKSLTSMCTVLHYTHARAHALSKAFSCYASTVTPTQ